MTGAQTLEAPKSLAERTRLGRALAAAALAGLALGYLLLGDPRVCTERLVGDTAETVEVCERVPATDPAVAAVAVLLLLLLAPDLAEASVVGLVTVKRQVAETKAAVAETAAEQAETRSLLASVRAEIAQTQRVDQQQNVLVLSGGAAELAAMSKYSGAPADSAVSEGLEPDSPLAGADAADRQSIASWRAAIAARAYDELPRLFTDPWGSGTVLGFVRADDGRWERFFDTGTDAPQAADAEQRLLGSGLLDQATTEQAPAADAAADPAMAAASALNAAGRTVAALGVVLPEGTPASDDPLLGAELERAAGIVARVMIDVLRLDTDAP